MAIQMTLDEFRSLLEVWGSNPDSWPDEKQAAALALASQSAEARTLLRATTTFDAVLNSVTPAPVSDGLRERVLTMPLPNAHTVVVSEPTLLDRWASGLIATLATIFRPAVAGAAIAGLAAGFALATSLSVPTNSDAPVQVVAQDTIPPGNGGASDENLVQVVASLSGGYAPDLSITDTLESPNGDNGISQFPLY